MVAAGAVLVWFVAFSGFTVAEMLPVCPSISISDVFFFPTLFIFFDLSVFCSSFYCLSHRISFEDTDLLVCVMAI